MELDYKNAIDVVEHISPEEFRENYELKEKPVVLRGLWDKYPALTKWSIDFFKETLGHIQVGVFYESAGQKDRSFKKPHGHMKFGDYLDKITSEPTDLRIFLFNIFKHMPELRHDFDFPNITKHFLKRFPFMFFGGGGSVVRIHQDMDWSNVFLTQLHGKKHVVLFHPKYSDLLYRYPFNVHSSVDIEKPDYDKYPGLRYVEGMECILNPGDTLFMPSGYWHWIKYLEGGYAISMRSLSPYYARRIKGLWHVAVLSNLDDGMRKVMGETWYKYKLNQTEQRANDAIKHMQFA